MVVWKKEDLLSEAKRVHGVEGDFDIQWFFEKYNVFVNVTTPDEIPDEGQIRLIPKPSEATNPVAES